LPSLSSTTASLLAISVVDLFSVLALLSSLSLLAKTVLSQQLAPLSQHFVTLPVNLLSCISAKAMSASVLLSLSVSQVFATLFL
jgi:hypothetical protein